MLAGTPNKRPEPRNSRTGLSALIPFPPATMMSRPCSVVPIANVMIKGGTPKVADPKSVDGAYGGCEQKRQR